MTRRGGRVFNYIGSVPFETFFGSWRLSWVTFFTVFPCVLIPLGAAQLIGIPGAVVFGVLLFALWFRFLVRPLNKHDPHSYVTELTDARGLIKALANRKTRPSLPGDRVRSE